MKHNNVVLFMILLFCSVIPLLSSGQSKRSIVNIPVAEKEYIRKFIFPLSSVEPDKNFSKDSAVFSKFFSNTKMIGIGEASHGAAEIFKIKNKLTRYILERNNGGVFSMEVPMPRASLVNEYIGIGNRTAKDYVLNLNMWIYQTEEILEMVEWMKYYNDQHHKKIIFTGFDMQDYTGSVNQIAALQTKYKIPTNDLPEIIKKLYEFKKLKRNQLSEKKHLREEILRDMEHLKQTKIHITNANDRSWFLQNLRILEQFLDSTYLKRNKYMAENISWIKNRYPEETMVIWAHNGHIKKTADETGGFLKEAYKDEYVNCGTFFYEGANSVSDNGTIVPLYIQKTPENYLENLLNSFNIPLFLLDLKSMKNENSELAKILLNKINYRTVGAVFTKQDFGSGNISNDFDYVIFIKSTTASKILKE